MTRRDLVMAFALAAGAFALYSWRLSSVPAYLHHDEVLFAQQAHSISTTARDMNGRMLPLYFEMHRGSWFHPAVVYASVPFYKVFPITTTTVRLPSAFVGALNVFLIYFVARFLFKATGPAALASATLALTPAHFIHSRLAMDYVYPVAFVLAWLLGLVKFLERRSGVALFAATTALGVGFYSYVASVIMMPVYFLMTLVLLWWIKAGARSFAVAAAGFAWPLTALLIFFTEHPSIFNDFVRNYHVYDPARLNPLQGAREFLNYTSLTQRAWLYWDYFNPSLYFFNGGSNLTNTTSRAGILLLPAAVFLAIGVYRAVLPGATAVQRLLLAGFLTGPLAAIMVDQAGASDRMLNVLPFAVLLVVSGAMVLRSSPVRWRKAAAVVLLIAMPLQFAYFASDYFTDYRLRSLFWFELDVRAGAEALLKANSARPAPAIYLSRSVSGVDAHWRWALTNANRLDLLQRTVYYDPGQFDLAGLPAGTLLMTLRREPAEAKLVEEGTLTRVADIVEPDGSVSFWILRR